MKFFNPTLGNRQNPRQRQLRYQPSLAACILCDLVGYASYALPFFGEILDFFWAPVSGVIFFMMFGGWKGAVGGVFSVIEEILPGTDFIPSFTLMWFMRKKQ